MISTVEKVLFLKGVDLFRNIPGEELSHIAQITDEEVFGPDHTIIKEGEPGDAMYLIVSGRVKVHSGDHELARLGSKQCFGEMSILDAEPRSASVTTVSGSSASREASGDGDDRLGVTVLRIAQSDFAEILTEKPEISMGIIKVLTSRLREANRR